MIGYVTAPLSQVEPVCMDCGSALPTTRMLVAMYRPLAQYSDEGGPRLQIERLEGYLAAIFRYLEGRCTECRAAVTTDAREP